jgi:ABC-type glutathione transport system ATPase component
MTETLLRVEGLSIAGESDGGLVPVVQDLALTVAVGETVGLVGESGSGKTVLARAILGLTEPPLRRTGGHVASAVRIWARSTRSAACAVATSR